MSRGNLGYIDFIGVLERIKEFKGLRFDADVAHLLGMRPEALSERKRRGSLPEDKLALFCQKEGLELNWLLTGEGERLVQYKPAEPGRMDYAKLGQYVRELRGQRSRDGFISRVGITMYEIDALEQGRGEPPIHVLKAVCDYKGITIDELLRQGKAFGEETEGEAPKGTQYEKPAPTRGLVAYGADWDSIKETKAPSRAARKRKGPAQTLTVKVFPLALVRDFKNEEYRIPVDELFMVPSEMTDVAPLGLKVEGDAMAPVLTNGAFIGLQYKNVTVVDGEVYVVRLASGEVFIRRLFEEPGRVVLKADNQAFSTITAKTCAVSVVGRVRWVIQGL